MRPSALVKWTVPAGMLLLVAHAPASAGAVHRLGTALVPFVENRGQVSDPSVAFLAQTFGGAVGAMENGEVVYFLPRAAGTDGVGGTVMRERLLHARRMFPAGAGRAETVISYFTGNDPRRWKAGLCAWNTISLGEPYEGIRMELRAHGATVEKVFTVAPGADPRRIRLAVSGADRLRVAGDGSMAARTPLGDVRFSAPVAYQESEQGRQLIPVAYRVRGRGYGFRLGAYDRARPLVIDPLLASTFLGGTSAELANDVRVDANSNVFVTGWTQSPDFPTTPGVYDATNSSGIDAFVSKLDNSLTNLLASTFLGGGGEDNAQIAALDAGGRVYVAGLTRSADFPTTTDAYDRVYAAAPDGFIAVLDNALTNLLASTYLGGSGEDWPRGIALDSVSNIIVTGSTLSSNYPVTAGAYDASHNGDRDVFVSKMSSRLTHLIASTFIGGHSYDVGLSVALDGGSGVYVAGRSYSTNYPTTPSAFAPRHSGWSDVLITKLDVGLSNLLASTFLGGSEDEEAQVVALDAGGRVVVAGWSESADYPATSMAHNPFYSGYRDAVISKLDADLANLLASTYVGGSGVDWFAHGLAFDAQGNIYAAGYSSSTDYEVTLQAYCPTNNGNIDVIISKLDRDLTNLVASTYLGGRTGEYATALASDTGGNVFIAGSTSSANYPTTPGAYDTTLNAANSVNLSKLDSGLSRPVTALAADFYGNPRRGPAPLPVVFKGLVAGANTDITWYGWDFDNDGAWDLQGAGLRTVTNAYLASGFHSIRMAVSNAAGESAGRTRRWYVRLPPLTFHVAPSGSNTLPYADWTTAATNAALALQLATHGDSVRVTDGVYRASPQVNVKRAVRFQSVNGAASTLLDAGGSNRCLYIGNTGAVVRGFTITGGNAPADDGGGVFISGAGTLEHCIVVSNTAQWGGGVYCWGGGVVQHCAIWANSATGNIMENPGAGGVACDSGGILRNCLVAGNRSSLYGGGVGLLYDGPAMENCTIAGNSAASGGGLVLYGGGTAVNCIVYGNASLDGNSNYWFTATNCAYTCTAPTVPGPGNIDADPLFSAPAVGNYRLAAGSPCVDKGTNLASVLDDLEDVPRPLDGDNDGTARPDMGAYEFVHPLADTDGDRMADGAELQAGCHPLDPQSYLGLESASRSAAGFVVRWQSVNWKLYRFERCTNLVTGDWSPVASNLLGIAPLNAATDTTAAGINPSFYRIGLEP